MHYSSNKCYTLYKVIHSRITPHVLLLLVPRLILEWNVRSVFTGFQWWSSWDQLMNSAIKLIIFSLICFVTQTIYSLLFIIFVFILSVLIKHYLFVFINLFFLFFICLFQVLSDSRLFKRVIFSWILVRESINIWYFTKS